MPAQRRDADGRSFYEREDPFNCAFWCGNGTELHPPTQASRHCTLPGFRRKWTPTAYVDVARLTTWMGRPRFIDGHGTYHDRPGEVAEDGCPGGWARCGFANSFAKYIRPRVQGGGHDSNPRVHRDTPEHILDALSIFETHQARAEAEFQRQIR
jgi:hypothetical protein